MPAYSSRSPYQWHWRANNLDFRPLGRIQQRLYRHHQWRNETKESVPA